MNINKSKCFECGEGMLNRDIIKSQFLTCEIKRKCFECGEVQFVDNPKCVNCFSSPNLTDNFKPEQNELDKLFIGAPVMVDDSLNTWYHKDYFHHSVKLRLPTIEESPHNTWLVPPLEMPVELENLTICIRYKPEDKIIVCQPTINWLKSMWKEIQAFQIIEDFKK